MSIADWMVECQMNGFDADDVDGMLTSIDGMPDYHRRFGSSRMHMSDSDEYHWGRASDESEESEERPLP